jgi:hypothetical protein
VDEWHDRLAAIEPPADLDSLVRTRMHALVAERPSKAATMPAVEGAVFSSAVAVYKATCLDLALRLVNRALGALGSAAVWRRLPAATSGDAAHQRFVPRFADSPKRRGRGVG